MVTHEVHRSSLMLLIFPAHDHIIFLTLLFINTTFPLSDQMLACLTLGMILNTLLSIFISAAASLSCAFFMRARSLHHNVIAGSTYLMYAFHTVNNHLCIHCCCRHIIPKKNICIGCIGQTHLGDHIFVLNYTIYGVCQLKVQRITIHQEIYLFIYLLRHIYTG